MTENFAFINRSLAGISFVFNSELSGKENGLLSFFSIKLFLFFLILSCVVFDLELRVLPTSKSPLLFLSPTRSATFGI